VKRELAVAKKGPLALSNSSNMFAVLV